MNNSAAKRTFDGKRSDELQTKLQKLVEKLKGDLYHMEKWMELSKKIFDDCNDNLKELRSKLTELESILEETTSNGKQLVSDADESVQKRNRLKKISDQDIIEEITIGGDEKSTNLRKASETENPNKRRKRHEDCEILSITPERNNECIPGTSKAAISIRPGCSDERTSDGNEDISEACFAEGAFGTALQKTKGVLPIPVFCTFLTLSNQVKDPVQLAKVSFTKEIKQLYFQLMTFHFYLQVANNAVEDERDADRELEKKVQHLVHAFQTAVENQTAS